MKRIRWSEREIIQGQGRHLPDARETRQLVHWLIALFLFLLQSHNNHASTVRPTYAASAIRIMPPKQSTSNAPRGRPPGSKNKPGTTAAARASKGKGTGKERVEARDSSPPNRRNHERDDDDVADEPEIMEIDSDDDQEKSNTIPPDLLTRILHEFFEKEGTRITKEANNAVAQYMDTFVKEAIARAAAERPGGFLEVSAGGARSKKTTILGYCEQTC